MSEQTWQQKYIDAYTAWCGTADVRIEKSGTWYWIVINGRRGSRAHRRFDILDMTQELKQQRAEWLAEMREKGKSNETLPLEKEKQQMLEEIRASMPRCKYCHDKGYLERLSIGKRGARMRKERCYNCRPRKRSRL